MYDMSQTNIGQAEIKAHLDKKFGAEEKGNKKSREKSRGRRSVSRSSKDTGLWPN
jgi:hypothetical protein